MRYGIVWCIVVRKLAENYIKPLKIERRLIGDCGLRPQVVSQYYIVSDIEVVAACHLPSSLCEREVPVTIKMRAECSHKISTKSSNRNIDSPYR